MAAFLDPEPLFTRAIIVYLLPGYTLILLPEDILIAMESDAVAFAVACKQAVPIYESLVILAIVVSLSTADHPEVLVSNED
jgi:hypothetical protein